MIIEFPGLINIHVHLRDPGATHKEDFRSGSLAGIKGGFTALFDMPNNIDPTISLDKIAEKKRIFRKKSKIFIGFYYGTDGKNLHTFKNAIKNPLVFGLKIYLNQTTGSLLIKDEKIISDILKNWKSVKPILAHAEEDVLEKLLFLSSRNPGRLHICHVSKASEIKIIKKYKSKLSGLTAGVTPHHLFLTQKNVLAIGSLALMKPELGTVNDKNKLWEAVIDKTIDIVESDHAPHTLKEKESSNPPYGVPNLEETLGLMLLAVNEGKIKLSDVHRFLYDNPKKFLNINFNTGKIKFDPSKSFIVKKTELQTKCGWSPFIGWKLYGRVEEVEFQGRNLMKKGKLLL